VPVVLDDGEPDSQRDVQLDVAVSDDDDEPILRTTPAPNARDLHTHVPAIPAKSIANGCAGGSAIDDASDGQVSNDPSVKPKEFDRMELSRPPLYRENDQPSSPASENTATTDRVVPHLEAPASAGHIHDVFAAYEKTFGTDSLARKSGQRKERSSSSSHGVSPVRDESLTLNPNEGSVRVEHGPPHSNCTMTSIPTKAGSGGLYTNHVTNMERGCSGPHHSRMEEQQQQHEPTRSTATPPNPPSRKRSGLPAGSHAPCPKRSRGSSQASAGKARKARKARNTEASRRSDFHKEKPLRHVFPRHCRDKEWDVGDLRVSAEEDGALSCELLWAPTTLSVSSLKGALLERAEELVKRDHGADTWDKWLEMQGKTGRRCRGRGGNASRK